MEHVLSGSTHSKPSTPGLPPAYCTSITTSPNNRASFIESLATARKARAFPRQPTSKWYRRPPSTGKGLARPFAYVTSASRVSSSTLAPRPRGLTLPSCFLIARLMLRTSCGFRRTWVATPSSKITPYTTKPRLRSMATASSHRQRPPPPPAARAPGSAPASPPGARSGRPAGLWPRSASPGGLCPGLRLALLVLVAASPPRPPLPLLPQALGTSWRGAGCAAASGHLPTVQAGGVGKGTPSRESCGHAGRTQDVPGYWTRLAS